MARIHSRLVRALMATHLVKQGLAFRATLVRAIERNGGGIRGLGVTAMRGWKVLRALGFRGFLVRTSGAQLAAVPAPSGFIFPAPAPLKDLKLRVGIMAHVFYADLADELAKLLRAMPVSYVLLVSVVDEHSEEIARKAFGGLPNLSRLQLKRVANRGRDLAPLFVDFHEEILALDLIAHIHTKKSLYTGSEQSAWRRYLTQSLFGTRHRLEWILGMFAAEPRLGIVYPESFAGVPLWAHTWLGNLEASTQLVRRLSLAIEPTGYLDFPAGSMFWARVEALRPIYDLQLSTSDFPQEQGQTDGTLQHALERMLVLVIRQHGFLAGVLPADGSLALADEGGRNWHSAFTLDVPSKLNVASIDADMVSLDVFDTLVTRPFLYPSAARAYLAELAERELGISNFTDLRERAEQRARSQAGHDVDLAEIYLSMGALPGAPDSAGLQALKSLELTTEARMLSPRKGVVDAIAKLKRVDRALIAVSDMYLSNADLQQVLPPTVAALPERWHVSCETHLRKDDGSAWTSLPGMEAVDANRWLHVGDNEHSDIQLPQTYRYLTPVHILRPSALLDIVPALRPLRPAEGSATHWHDQLMLGLATRHLADLADLAPGRFGTHLDLPTARSFGYLVVGPLLADYTAWLVRLARDRHVDQILFLAREGHLLQQAFARMQSACPSVANIRGDYLLTSRRCVGMASITSEEQIAFLLGNTYTGTLFDLVLARMGLEAAQWVASNLGQSQAKQHVFLPEMRAGIQDTLSSCVDGLLRIAANERSSYLAYWNWAATGEHLLLADIGYSGTIQKHLSRLTRSKLGGAYFAVNQAISTLDAEDNWAVARYHDARDGQDASIPVLNHNLLLEAVLTSPSGQLLRFHDLGKELPEAEFAPHDTTPAGLSAIIEAQQGALNFVSDLCDLTQDKVIELAFDKSLVQTPLHCFGTKQWTGGAWLNDIGVTDLYTGRGAVTASG